MVIIILFIVKRSYYGNQKHYYTIKEVMEMLDIGKSAVYNMLYTSEIPRISKGVEIYEI